VDTALVFVDRCLHWFFHRPASSAAARLTLDDQPLWNCDPELYALAVELEQVSFDSDTLVAQLGPGKKQAIWLRSPALPAALAEQLLEQRRNADARKVLDVAQSRFQHDLRLRQLEGLCLSREGRLDEAQAILEALDDKEWSARPAEDFETSGILAGVYKRQWDKTGSRDWLVKAHATYEAGWQDSREKNTYLGINAAATALWLGETARVAPFAERVLAVLRKRERAMAILGGPPRFVLSFWDQVTLAEALLLLGSKPEARTCYQVAFRCNPEKQANIDGAREQAIKDLRAQGETKEQAESFFN
jgi:tetratricopeptide (TPR) repeat protein